MAWPEQVIILDDHCNLSGPYGPPTRGYPPDDGFPQAQSYPNTYNEWVSFSFRDKEGNANYLDLLAFETIAIHIGTWMSTIIANSNNGDRDEEYFRLMSLKRPYTLDNYNYRARVTYNLTWAYFDYGPYETPVPELLAYMKDHALFQKSVAEGIARRQSPFQQKKPNAKKVFERPASKKWARRR